MNNNQVFRNRHGFLQIQDLPTKEYLKKYYAEKYFQVEKKETNQSRLSREIVYFENKFKEIEVIINKHLGKKTYSLLDLGAGEGWELAYFAKKGIEVLGVDYSEYGVESCNPDMIDNFLVGDIDETLNELIGGNKKFDVITLNHVLEHVLDPIDLVSRLSKIINKGGILIIKVPNDFSLLQKYLLENQFIDKEFWLAPPDHLNYFDKNSLIAFIESFSYSTLEIFGDFPIDINLFNPDTNYVQKKDTGKRCYDAKLAFDTYLHKTFPVEKIVEFYSSILEVDLGRSITGFFRYE